jgi:LuxR family maltose regulon positive regulatory protein
MPDLLPAAALKTRAWARLGRLPEALEWAREAGVSVDDEMSYPREFEHVTLARVLVARYRKDRDPSAIRQTLDFIERLLRAAEAGGRTGSVIDILVTQALAHEAQGEIPAALASLERALALAEPEGYVRVFLDEGVPMGRLLSEAAARGRMRGYAAQLLAGSGAAPSRPLNRTPQPLIEPLSERELEVLRLVAQGLSNHEIGERLYLALSTVKGHNRIIFDKLQVERRTEAVARARELGLI